MCDVPDASCMFARYAIPCRQEHSFPRWSCRALGTAAWYRASARYFAKTDTPERTPERSIREKILPHRPLRDGSVDGACRSSARADFIKAVR